MAVAFVAAVVVIEGCRVPTEVAVEVDDALAEADDPRRPLCVHYD